MISKEEALIEVVKRKCINDFWKYCLYMDYSFFTEREHRLKPLADCLQANYDNQKKKTSLNFALPRREGKTYTIDLFCSWSLGKDLTREIIRVSYNSSKAEESNASIYNIMNSDKYKTLFHLPPLVVDTKKEKWFKGHYRPSLIATGVIGGSTGGGAQILIADDIYRGFTDALSNTINERTISNYYTNLQSSLDGKNNLEIVIGTRWRVGELADEMEKNNEFDEIIKMKALDKNNKSISPIYSTEDLLNRRNKYGESIFNAMFQQEAQLTKDGLFKVGDFKYLNIDDFKQIRTTNRICVIDPKSTGKDYLSLVIINITPFELVLEDVIYTNEVVDEVLVEKMKGVINYYKPELTFLETNKDYSLSLMLKGTHTSLNTFSSFKNKEAKILSNNMFLKDICFLSVKDKEYNEAIDEIYRYDLNIKNQHDDMTDVLTMAVMKIKENSGRLKWTKWNKETTMFEMN